MSKAPERNDEDHSEFKTSQSLDQGLGDEFSDMPPKA